MSLTAEQQTTVRDSALVRGIPAAFALGVVDKESAGRAFYKVNGKDLPAIRYEGHYLYRLLKAHPAVQNAAVKAGFAAKSSGVVKNPGNMASRYTFLERVIAFLRPYGLEDLAYQSISIGIGQVMGSHFNTLGYNTAQGMFSHAVKDFEGQVDQMLEFIYVNKNLLKAAQDFNFTSFAKGYNGPNYKQNNYDTDLQKYVAQYDEDFKGVPVADPWIARIKALGFDNVMAFQSSIGAKVDGIIGPITREGVVNAEKARAIATKPPVSAGQVLAGTVATTVVTAAASAPDVTTSIVTSVVPVIDPVVKAITTLAPLGLPFVIAGAVIVVGVVAFLWFKNRK